MIIQNDADLERVLSQAITDYLNQIANEIQEVIQEFVQQYYDEYQPKRYERTMQFLQSCTRTEVEQSGNTLSCKIYIDTDSMNYAGTGAQPPSGEEVADWANQGMHGGSGVVGGSHFWDNSITEIENRGYMLEHFASFLRGKGFRVN